MSAIIDTRSTQKFKGRFMAHALGASTRQNIALQAIGKSTPISHIADQYDVSRKFVYDQRD